jgi:hypothetical protein
VVTKKSADHDNKKATQNDTLVMMENQFKTEGAAYDTSKKMQ